MNYLTSQILIFFTILHSLSSQHWSRGFQPLGKRSAAQWFPKNHNNPSDYDYFQSHKVKIVNTPETRRKVYELLQMLEKMQEPEREVFKNFLEDQLGIDFGMVEPIEEEQNMLRLENRKNSAGSVSNLRFMR